MSGKRSTEMLLEVTQKIDSGEILKRPASIRPGHLVIGVILLSLIPTAMAAFFLLSPQRGGEALIRIRLADIPVAQGSSPADEAEEVVTVPEQVETVDGQDEPAVPAAPSVREGRSGSASNAPRLQTERSASPREDSESAPSVAVTPSPVPPSTPRPSRAQEVSRPNTVTRTANQRTVAGPVQNVAPAQRSESTSLIPPAAVEPRPEQEGSDTDDVREALRDIRPR